MLRPAGQALRRRHVFSKRRWEGHQFSFENWPHGPATDSRHATRALVSPIPVHTIRGWPTSISAHGAGRSGADLLEVELNRLHAGPHPRGAEPRGPELEHGRLRSELAVRLMRRVPESFFRFFMQAGFNSGGGTAARIGRQQWRGTSRSGPVPATRPETIPWRRGSAGRNGQRRKFVGHLETRTVPAI